LLFALAILAMPLSSAVKLMLGEEQITWVNPTLVLALLLFILLKFPIRATADVVLLGCALLSGTLGALFVEPGALREKSGLYLMYMEPVRLGLNLCWFSVCVAMLKLDRKFVVKWLVIGVVAEGTVAAVLMAAMLGFLSVQGPLGLFLDIYKLRQSVWIAGIHVYRTAGTFVESAPFGLFMFCCFAVLLNELRTGRVTEHRRAVIVATAVSLIGTIAAFADQVLLGLVVFCFGALFFTKAKRSAMRTIAAVLLVGVVAVYATGKVISKWELAASTAQGDIYAQSGAERMFHTKYGLGLLAENPFTLVTGIGPGRYGDYAVRTGLFPSTVGIQVTPVEWLVEFGVLGTWAILVWLWSIARPAVKTLGPMALVTVLSLVLANLFQANWMWEAFFLALAFLYCAGEEQQESISILSTANSNDWSTPKIHGASAI
jgi:hypothetical protein